jgi:hypothetical protein
MRKNNIGFASNDVGSDTYEIYRAIVVEDPDINPDDKTFRIYVKEAKASTDRANGGVKEAYPPSPLPVGDFGEGMISHPPKNTECIVMETKFDQKVQILTYVRTANAINGTPFGIWSPEILSRGSVFAKVGIETPASLLLTPEGLGSLYCGPLANIEIDGKSKAVKTTSVSSVQTFTGGKVINDYFAIDPYSGLANLTPHTEVYLKSQESPGDADAITELSETTLLTATSQYTDKAIVRAGAITNPKKNTELFGQHPYQIETRQATDDTKKNLVTMMRFGDPAGQNAGSYRFSNNDFYPRGTVFEISSKRIHEASTDTYLFRQGEYEDDITVRAGLTPGSVIDGVKGEIFRHQIYTGITPSVKGLLLDNMGEGKGYDFKLPNYSAKQHYVESFGILKSSDAPIGMRDTIWRKHVHGFNTAPINIGGGYSRTQILGGSLLYSDTIEARSLGQILYGVYYTTDNSVWKSETIALGKELVIDGEFNTSAQESAFTSTNSGETLQVSATANFIDTVREQMLELTGIITALTEKMGAFINIFTGLNGLPFWTPVPMDGGASLKLAIISPGIQMQTQILAAQTQITQIEATIATGTLNYDA